MLKEFRDFIARGNVIDLAVAVIIGAAFGAIVTSLVNDVLMPPIGKLMGGIDFKDYYVVLDRGAEEKAMTELAKPTGAALSLGEARAKAVPVIAYGQFINNLVNFLIVAFCVFLLVKLVNQLKRPTAVGSMPALKDCPFCCTPIAAKATKCAHCTSAIA
jgi:large conductance mechanosensitive channel